MPDLPPITFGVLTVSDTCSLGKAVDLSGPALRDVIAGASDVLPGATVRVSQCVPDDIGEIKVVLRNWCDILDLDVILTTGGTGFAPRDLTPEATRLVIDKEAPGLATAMLTVSLNKTPFAMLSRGICGIRGHSLIINLPGSVRGATECFSTVTACLPHAVALLRDRVASVKQDHTAIQHSAQCNAVEANYKSSGTLLNASSKVDETQVARRLRKSPYPMFSVEEAQNIIMTNLVPNSIEVVPMKNAVGRVLSRDILAQDNLPPFRASIKDGYAMLAADNAVVKLVVGESTAGAKANGGKVLAHGECVRINTGAPVPAGCDCVVQVEDTRLLEESEYGMREVRIEVLNAPTKGQDIRAIGSDIAAGCVVLRGGSVLSSSDLGLLAAVGAIDITVYRLPAISVLSTGSELVEPCVGLRDGMIRDSNKTTLMALLAENGFAAYDMGIAADVPSAVLVCLNESFNVSDVVISTGSVSMGDKDFLKQVLIEDFGATIHFGRVAMKPGKPTTFATCLGKDGRQKMVFGLPGNPASATTTMHLFVLPALRSIMNHPQPFPTCIKAKVDIHLVLDERPEYKRASLLWNDGIPTAKITGNQISSRLLSYSGANCLLCIPKMSNDVSVIRAGSTVDALIISRI